ncbi:N(6)-adenine-specific methyltransferase METTL4 [Spea bombifrons]|uniref:N(6)-adenine-specific methyltransferase METTL4 n=1 Tax=Spea bombifrons TaxID=233779 RepID=UPI0023493AD1|nr:N(6)-adenine-specific methyltransferase METTL4 [Spea bombifrons]
MSVVCKSPSGWLLDELLLLNKWYQYGGGLCRATDSPSSQGNQSSTETFYSYRSDLFKILKPHIATSKIPVASAPLHDQGKSDTQQTDISSPTLKKAVGKVLTFTLYCCVAFLALLLYLAGNVYIILQKRKRSTCLNQGELDALAYHKKISGLILEGSMGLIHEGLEKGFLQPVTEDENSEVMSRLFSNTCRLAELCDMAKQMPVLNMSEHAVHALDNTNPLPQDFDFVSRITENNSYHPQIVQLLGEKYLIPPKSSFLLSDISCMEPLLQYHRYNVIVIDPPWENKSVKRSKSYSYLSPMEMKQLPIPALAESDCLVVTWVTNRQKHLRFVKEELYPHWLIKTLAEWHWVKITRSGEYVFPLDSDHKKPYEILILGRLEKDDCSSTRSTEKNLPPIPQQKLIVSAPCKLHSHKPPLSEILKEYVTPDAYCLELFARNLQPGWTSWGNEVLKFQHMDYFTKVTKIY